MTEKVDVAEIRSLLRAAAEEEPQADLVRQAWSEASRQHRRARGAWAAGIAAAGAVAVGGAWFSGVLPPSPDTDAASAHGEALIGADEVTTFVFQPKGKADWRDFSQGDGRPDSASPVDPRELEATHWELNGVLIGTVVTWPEEAMPGVPDELFPSELIFSAQQETPGSLSVVVNPCGEVMRLEHMSIDSDGLLSGKSTDHPQDCTAAAAVKFWQDSLQGAWLHEDGGVIYLSVVD